MPYSLDSVKPADALRLERACDLKSWFVFNLIWSKSPSLKN